MKLMHLHAKSRLDVKLPEGKLRQLPEKKWGVVTTIQHEHNIKQVIDQLGAVNAGQVIGCNASGAELVKDKVDAWLFVGSGFFHPVKVALQTGQPVWLWNPATKELKQLDQKLVKDFERQKQASVNRFLHAEKVGIIVSTKIGQKNLMRAFELARRKDKQYFIFACDELDVRKFEDFNFIDFWVNTACPRIADDKVNVVNVDDLIDAGIVKLEKESTAYEVPIWKSRMGLKD